MREFDFVKTEFDNSLFIVTLARLEKNNAFHAQMIRELTIAIGSSFHKDDCRALLIKAEGKHFSAGADLNYMKSMSSFTHEENVADAEQLFELFDTIYNCPVPVIAAVHGGCFGGANGIIAAADYVISSDDATFSFSEVKLGLVAATISPFVVLKVGVNNATHLFSSGMRFSAQQGLQFGLVHHVVPQHNLEASVHDYLSNFHKAAPNAIRESKKLARSYALFNPGEYKETTAKTIANSRISEEGQEGIQAFFDKRKPNWSA